MNKKYQLKHFKIVGPVLSLMLSLMLAGCSSSDPDALAEVGGKVITKQAFDSYLKFKRINATDESKYNKLLEQYLERETLALAIEQKALLDKPLTDAELNEFRKEMLISRYFEKYLKEKVTDQAVLNYYNANAELYEKRKVNVAHILLRTNRNMGENERQTKYTVAREAYSKIQTGQAFDEIAQKYSEDTISGKKGGDLGWLNEGAIDKRFSEKVFSLKPGEVTEPFETSFGFHIVKLIEGPVTAKSPLEAVAGDIRYQLRNKARDAELQQLLAQFK